MVRSSEVVDESSVTVDRAFRVVVEEPDVPSDDEIPPLEEVIPSVPETPAPDASSDTSNILVTAVAGEYMVSVSCLYTYSRLCQVTQRL